ncbi:MAG: tyrosine-type recombinase/integrase [Thermaceae bacterium]|nr:tyrosine-type recombinase/integrase [Thermaceae bacterium]
MAGKNANNTGSVFYKELKKRWVAQVQVGYYANGRPRFRTELYKKQGDAEKARLRMLSELGRGELAAPDRLTVSELLSSWLAWKTKDLRETTADSYERVIRLYLGPLLGRTRVQALTRSMIEQAYAAMREPRADHRGNGKTYIPSVETVNVAARVLRQALKEWGVGRGIIAKNPAEGAKLPRNRQRRGEAGGGRPKYEPYSNTELRKFLDATLEHPLFIAFFLAGALGLRQGEVAGLRWAEVDIEPDQLSSTGEGKIRVRAQRTRVRGRVIEGPPKSGNGDRSVPLWPNAVAILHLHQRQQMEWAEEYGWEWSRNGYVVANPKTGLPLRPDSIWRRFRAITSRIGLRPVAFHDLRRGFVSIMHAEGVPLEVISKLVGHHSPSFTAEAYRHIFAFEGLAATRAMGAVVPDAGSRVLPLPGDREGTEDAPELTPLAPQAKLTPHQARRVKERIEAGERPEDVALDYGISGRMARYIASGKRHARSTRHPSKLPGKVANR